MTKLKEALDHLPEEVREAMGQGLKLRLTELKKLHKALEKAGFDTEAMDEEMELISGTKEKTGLLTILGVVDPDQAPDPLQEDLPLDKDFRTWSLTDNGVRELVASVASDNTPVAAERILNALEDGEKEREGGSRANVLKTIRAARSPLSEKVARLQVEDGGAH